MSPAEVSFLVVGLVFGVVVGSALVTVLRTRPGPRRNVRVTIAPNAIPVRRASTLGVTPGVVSTAPVPGSPEDGALTDDEPAPGLAPVPAVATAPAGTPIGTRVPSPPPDTTSGTLPGIREDAVAIPIVPNTHPDTSWALPRAGGHLEPRHDREESAAAAAQARRALVDARRAVAEETKREVRRLEDELAGLDEAHSALRRRVDHARTIADPERIAEVRGRLHAAFQARAARAPGPAEAEAGARAWAEELARLDRAVTETDVHVARGEAELDAMRGRMEELGHDVAAARIAADLALTAYADALAGFDMAPAPRGLALPVPAPVPVPGQGRNP